MRRSPRPPQESVFAHGLGIHVIWVGLLMAALTIGTQAWFLSLGSAHWQTMVFMVLSLSQLANVLAVIFAFVLQMVTIYVPILNGIFKTKPLSAVELTVTLVISSMVFFAVEAEKWWRRRLARR